MAHIRKRGKKYCVMIELEKSEEGKRRQKSVGTFETLKKAKEVLVRTENARLNNTYIEKNKITLDSYFKKYFDEELQSLAKTTQVDYLAIYKNYISKYFNAIRLQEMSVAGFQNYFSNYISHLSPQSIRKHYALFNGVFTKAFKNELISKNLCDYVTLPKAKKTKPLVRLDLSEMKLLLEQSKGDLKFEVPILLSINLGLRSGEILGLSWDDVNFENNTININRTFTVIKEELIFKEPKSESSKRYLIANPEVMESLKKEKLRQEEEELKNKDFNNELNLVCVNQNGRYRNPRTFSKEFSLYLEKIEFPKKIRFHDLRHANATLMLASGVPAKVASKRLGHSKISTTLDIYTDVLKEVEESVADKLQNILYKSK